MSSASNPFILRPLTLEYRVSGRLDGVTPSPPYAVPPSQDAPVGDAQKLIFEVENLGLIDLTGRGGDMGLFAGRFVNTTTLYGPLPPSGGANVGIAFEGVLQRSELDVPDGTNGVFSRRCIFVPQTGQLRVDGMEATPGNPVIVRLSVWQPQTMAELAAMIEACCCLEDCVTESGDPCFTRAILSEEDCARVIETVRPSQATENAGVVVFNVTGAGFQDGDSFAFVHEDGTAQIEVENVTIISENEAEVMTNISSQLVGFYDLTVASSVAPQCSFTLPDAVEIVA